MQYAFYPFVLYYHSHIVTNIITCTFFNFTLTILTCIDGAVNVPYGSFTYNNTLGTRREQPLYSY